MADTEPVDNSLPFADITGKIKQADKTAREMYTRLDRFMEENAKKSKITQPTPQSKDQKDVEKEVENTESKSNEESKDIENEKIENNVVTEISNEFKQSNEQIENFRDQEQKNTQSVLNAVEQLDKQQSEPQVNEMQVRQPQSEEKAQPKIEVKNNLPEQKEPLNIKITAEPENTQPEIPTPASNQVPEKDDISQTEKVVEKETIKVVENKTNNISENREVDDMARPTPVQQVLPLVEPLDVTTTDFKVAENIVNDITQPIEDKQTEQPEVVLKEDAKETEQFDAGIDKNIDPNTNIVENIVEKTTDVEPEKIVPEVIEDKQEPFIAAAETNRDQEIPQVVVDSKDNAIAPLNASDESLLSISKSLENITQVLKQNQDKLVNSITSLNNTTAEILKMLPNLQSSQQPNIVGGASQQNKRRQTDTTNIIGNFRDSLNITTRGYKRNTVFPGNNSIV